MARILVDAQSIACHVIAMDRARALNWWTGRFTDQDLAAWTGLAPRAVGLVLALPALQGGVSGGGRGGRFSRRIDPKTRNAVAIVQALSETGLPFDLASKIATATPYLLGAVSELIDYSLPLHGVVSLAIADPAGNWREDDVVPATVWGRMVRPCRRLDDPTPTVGSIFLPDADQYQPNTPQGTMTVTRPDGSQIEIIALGDQPIYGGEPDPLGLLVGGRTEAVERLDEHMLIVDGRWLFHKSPTPSPREVLAASNAGRSPKGTPLTFDIDPVAEISADRKSVRVIGWGRDEVAQEEARAALVNHASLIDINMTFAVRRMKRRALGIEQ